MSLKANNRGFTLIELAIALVVIGIVISLGITLVGPLTKRVRFNESREIVNAAVESVNSYTAGNNKIPRLDSSVPADEFTPAVRNSNDAFGRALVYIYDSNLAPASATKDTVCGRKTALITVNADGVSVPKVAYLILSSGDDYVVDTNIGGTAVSSGPLSAATVITADTDDDIVKWVTLDELRTKMGCKGGQLQIVNNELPYGFKASSYSAALYADGGVTWSDGGDSGAEPDYEWCWESSAVLTDLTVTCNGTLAKTTSPAICSLSTGTWNRCTSPGINGTPNTAPGQGSYDIKFSLRDNDGSIVSKIFVLTINPQN